MDTGRQSSRILSAIQEIDHLSNAEVRVHLSRRWIDPHPLRSAGHLLNRLRSSPSPQTCSILLYFNLRKKTFALCADERFFEKSSEQILRMIATHLEKDLHSTHYENAIALALNTLSVSLQKYFPRRTL